MEGCAEWEMKAEWATQESAEVEIYNPVATAVPLMLPEGMFTYDGDACVDPAEHKFCELGDCV